MYPLSIHEITRVAQAAFGALSYILPEHVPAKRWEDLNEAERTQMQEKIQHLIDNQYGTIADRIPGFVDMSNEEKRKHILLASIVSCLLINEQDLQMWFKATKDVEGAQIGLVPARENPLRTSAEEPAGAAGSQSSNTQSTSQLPGKTSSEQSPGLPQSTTADSSSGNTGSSGTASPAGSPPAESPQSPDSTDTPKETTEQVHPAGAASGT